MEPSIHCHCLNLCCTKPSNNTENNTDSGSGFMVSVQEWTRLLWWRDVYQTRERNTHATRTSDKQLSLRDHGVGAGLSPAAVLPCMLQQDVPDHQVHSGRLLQLWKKKKKRKVRYLMSLNVPDAQKKCDSFTSCSGSCGLRDSCLIQVLARCYILQLLVFSLCWNEKCLRRDWE